MKKIVGLMLLLSICLARAEAQKKLPRFGKVDKKQLQAKTYENDTTAGAVILFQSGEIKFEWNDDVGFQYVLDFHTRIKILTQAGLEYADVEIPFNSSYEELSVTGATSYNLVGNKVERMRVGRRDYFQEDIRDDIRSVKFTFPDVKEGSIIEYRYRLTSKSLYNLRNWYFQHEIPTAYNQLRITIPEYYTYRHNRKGYIPMTDYKVDNKRETFAVTVESLPGHSGVITHTTYNVTSNSKEHTYIMKEVPAFKEEPYITTPHNYVSHLAFELQSTKGFDGRIDYYTTNWKQVSEVLMEHTKFGKRLSLPGSVQDEVTRIIDKCETDQEKLAALYDWVQVNIKWDKTNRLLADNSPRNVYNSKTGSSAEINLLLTAMLRYAGIDANPLILSTRKNGIINPAYPSIGDFNYVIAHAQLEDQEVLLDATEKNSPAGLLPVRCINGYSRLLGEQDREINIVGTRKAKYLHTLNLKIIDDKLIGRYSGNRDNIAAVHLRNSFFASAATDSYVSELEKSYSGMTVTNFELSNLFDYNDPIDINYDVEISEKIDIAGDRIYLNPMIFWGQDKNPFQTETRQYPIDYAYPYETTYHLMLAVPDGYEVDFLPDAQIMRMEDNIATFMYGVNNLGGIIQITSQMSVNTGVVSYLKYQALKEFYSMMVKKHAEQIVLKKI